MVLKLIQHVFLIFNSIYLMIFEQFVILTTFLLQNHSLKSVKQ